MEPEKKIIVQLNPYSFKDLLYLYIAAFVAALSNYLDLSSVPSHNLPQVFIVTGCDYIFSRIGKATLR